MANEPFEIKYGDETEELIYSDHDVDVVIDYFWDSHGKYTEFDGPNGKSRDEIHADTIKIIEVNRKLICSTGVELDDCTWRCFINGEQLECLYVLEYSKRKRLFIKAVVGTG